MKRIHGLADMTRGKPSSHIVRFALPLMGCYALQQLYTLADGIVIGRLLGVQAFAAVGTAGFLVWMVISLVMGFTQGFGTRMAQRFGAGDTEGFRQSAAMAVWIAIAVVSVIMAVGLGTARSLLLLLNTPEELIANALIYLHCIIAGLPACMAYNLYGALLYAVGNSRTPLLAIALASVLSILADVVLVAFCGAGVAGAAILTDLSQLCPFGICFGTQRKMKMLMPQTKDFRPDARVILDLLRLGAPLAARNAVIATGGLMVQAVVNGFGELFVAGLAAAKRYYGVLEIACAGLEVATGTFCGQNAGAGNFTRIKQGLRVSRRLGLFASLMIAVPVYLLAPHLIALLVTDSAGEISVVFKHGTNALRAMALCLPALYWLCLHRAAIQGMGYMTVPALSGFTELLFRLLSVHLLTTMMGLWGIYLADGIGWAAGALLVFITYTCLIKNKERSARRLIA
ncbi:MAG: MATE family efflux transporter [Clostridia bacterium]|nr:MATE family efflux transporter [Clostridia bacterium]